MGVSYLVKDQATMLEIFWCCTIKEATRAGTGSIVKLAIEVVSVYAFRDTVTKIYFTIAVIMNIFIQDLIRDNQSSV